MLSSDVSARQRPQSATRRCLVVPRCRLGANENAGVEKSGADCRVENAGVENAGVENAGVD